jgi:anti-anti-sigma factor
MPLNITKSHVDGITIFHLSGDILFGEESASLRSLVKSWLNKSPKIVLDLGNVTRIDSGGMGTLVELHVSAGKVGCRIKLANLGDHANEVLQITRLVVVFDIFRETEDAIASFKVATDKA